MPDLRISTALAHRTTQKRTFARFVELTPDLAAAGLDDRWWNRPPGSTEGQGEEDADWNWKDLATEANGTDYWEAIALQTSSGALQGAMVYRVDAKSVLVPGVGAVFVENLATAPWNRKRVTSRPEYGGVGPELLCQAVHHSHVLGFKGRVLLTSLPGAVDFYEGRGFVNTSRTIENLPLYELPEGGAREWLIEKGLVGNG